MSDREGQKAPDARILDELGDLTSEEFTDFCEFKKMPPDERENLAWWLAHGWRYFERPVDVETFLFSPNYMKAINDHGRRILWPAAVQAVKDICEKPYVEAVLTGGIGVAKTTIALYVQAYEQYKMLCQRDLHGLYGLDPSSEILTIFQSLNLVLSADVDYRRYRNMLDKAVIFRDPLFTYDKDIQSEMRFNRNVICKPVAGHEEAALSQNVIGGIIDELASMQVVQKSKRTKDRGSYDQAVALYNSISRRRESRFLELGEMPGKLCLVSSKKYPDDLIHQKIDEARTRPDRIYVYDKKLWDVKPWAFGKERFHVFHGDLTRKPRIMDDGEEIRPEDRDLTHGVPVELREGYDRDLIGSLRDTSGIASLSIHPFILNREALAECFGVVGHCISQESCDFIYSKCRIFPNLWKGTEKFPRWLHLDLAKTRDSVGLAIGHVRGFKRMRRSSLVDEVLPIVVLDVILEIIPPRGGEVNYEKIRKLIYMLREHGMPIKWATCDQFQSTDMLQLLASRGFLVGQESMDRTPAPYEVLKTTIYDGRLEAPIHTKAMSELTRLEWDPNASAIGKVDHPPDGSKDVADSIAAVCFGLSLQTEIWQQFGIELSLVPETLLQAAERSKTVNQVEGII